MTSGFVRYTTTPPDVIILNWCGSERATENVKGRKITPTPI